MKQLKIGITALALLVGVISAFTSKASRFAGTYWTTVVTHKKFIQVAAPNPPCTGGSTLCANQYTVGGTATGAVAFKH